MSVQCSCHSDYENSNNYPLACWPKFSWHCTGLESPGSLWDVLERPGKVRSARRCPQQRRTRSEWSRLATPSPWRTRSRLSWRARSLQLKWMFPKIKHPLVKQVRISDLGWFPRKKYNIILNFFYEVESIQIRQRSKSPNPVKDKGL